MSACDEGGGERVRGGAEDEEGGQRTDGVDEWMERRIS